MAPRESHRITSTMRNGTVNLGSVVIRIRVLDSFCTDDCPRSRTRKMYLLETQYVQDFCIGRQISVIPGKPTNSIVKKAGPACVISSYPRTLRFIVCHLLCNVCALHRFQLGSGSVFQSISLSSRTCKESTLKVG